MAEVVLSAFLTVMFERLLSRELLNFVRREGLGKKLDEWNKMLIGIEAVLDDADEKQHTKALVKIWLDDLRDFAYDLEDILDEFVTEALRRKSTGGDQASSSRVRKLIPACCNAFTPSSVWINMKLRSEIEEITVQFNRMVARKDKLQFSEIVGRRSHRTSEREAQTSLVNKDHVYGRKRDQEVLLQLLVGEKHSDAQLSVIPIVSMGGIGKTTLARLVYNDEQVEKNFGLRAWACVSEYFDAVKVTNAILRSLCESRDESDLNLLQVKLKETLKGKKFLIVLDDLWNDDYCDWTNLRAPFEEGAPGSTIIITTRNQEVARITSTNNQAHHLEALPDHHCLSILAQNALGTEDFNEHPNLKDVGQGIVGRCNGSPLAAKVLGGVLKNKLDPEEWKKVLKSKIWDLRGGESLSQALMLSYHHLPLHLKRCFAYCSILPKDYEFEEHQLVLLWMAEGFIQPKEGEKQMEDLGEEYFQNLLSMSFFQISSSEKSRFVMHDLINDLAQQVAGDISFKMEDRVGGNNKRESSRKARHSSFVGDIKKFEASNDLTCLRTFLPLMRPIPGEYYLTCNVLPKLLQQLRRVRVLSLSRYDISELPDSIGDLKHLRFLDLSHTTIKNLPESATNLYNLQTLILEHCLFLKNLPSKFGNLINLRHLNILGANALEGMPPRIGNLTCLQSLSNFLVVRKGSCSVIKELGRLSHLGKTLCISGLENVINPEDARGAKLFEKHCLYGLSLEWSDNLDESQDRTSELEVLNMLQPHEGLKDLAVKHYGGAEFSTWLRDPPFSNMVLLRIEYCEKCTLLPPVGQLQSLRDLFIEGMASMKNIGNEFYGDCSQPFKSLETLHFKNMQEWENWIPCDEFPKLRELSITRCPKLVNKLPNHLPSLEKIVIRECRQLVSLYCFPEQCELEMEGSIGVLHKGKVEFSSLHISSLSTFSEVIGQNEGFILEGLTNVKDLTISSCEELTALWSNDVGLLQQLPCLDALKINDCTKLVSMAAKEGEKQPKLRKIEIKNCEVLESLPKEMMCNNTYLEEVYIRHCTSLRSIAIGQLPPTLKRLKIEYCNMLILVEGDDMNSCGSRTSLLEYLEIRDCPLLKSLTSSGELPATLKHLQIMDCEKLESIAKSFHHSSSLEVIKILSCENLKSLPIGMHNLNHLDEIHIWRCPTLVSFQLENNGLNPANLRTLSIFECNQMQALPNYIHNLTSLQKLQIGNFPSIVSFPEEGFPTNLTSLSIHDMVSFNEALFEWGLYKLTSLKELVIHGGSSHLVSFPEMILPSSLTTLSIHSLPNLEYLSSKGFQFLSSLEELRIEGCKRLTAFPEDGLPLSLLQLHIKCCPLLKERCKKDQGLEWFKIAHIPCVQIDDRFIHEPEEESQ